MGTDNLSIFVQRASERLTDHESHGDGLICYSLLNGLAERGHQIYAYTDSSAIRASAPSLHIQDGKRRIPANSLGTWEHGWRANQWLKQLTSKTSIDLVWRMHPYETSCPLPPHTGGRPLVIGPLFYSWPASTAALNSQGKPRFGIGLEAMLKPIASWGWQRTLHRADLVICSTERHAASLQAELPRTPVLCLPVIVDGTRARSPRRRRDESGPYRLLFAANLVAQKNPQIFCQTIKRLIDYGVEAEGIILGDGPERSALEKYCCEQGIDNRVRFEGKVPNKEVYCHLQDADFLLSASLGEPYGRSIAEAMSMGTPCVCHRSGGPQDIIENGKDGLLVDALDASAYASSIMSISATPGSWEQLSQSALAKSKAWTKEAVLDHLEERLLALSAQR